MVLSEIDLYRMLPQVVFGNDFPSRWAKAIGNQSGFPFTKQEQLDLFRELRMGSKTPDSDRKIYARVLEETEGPAEEFKEKYPWIFNPPKPTPDVNNEPRERVILALVTVNCLAQFKLNQEKSQEVVSKNIKRKLIISKRPIFKH